MTRTPVEALTERAAHDDDALAYGCGDTRTTYGELARSVSALAGALARAGVRRGDRVALVMGTSLETVRALLAVQWLGAAPVVLNPHLPVSALRRRLERAHCRLALASGPGIGVLDEAEALVLAQLPGGRAPSAAACTRDETAFLQFTSGTSGEPRAALLTYRGLTSYLATIRQRMDVGPADVLVSWVPLHHDLGLVLFGLGPVVFGRPAHLLQPSLRRLDLWLETLGRERGTITASPDFGYRLAERLGRDRRFDLGALRFAVDGGEPVRLSTVRAFEARFGLERVVRPGYGLAEATLGVSGYRAGEPLRVDAEGRVACGRPLEGLAVRIARPDAGGQGEIEVRGPQLFAGYLGDPEATQSVLGGGWLRTGDLGRLDDDGYLYVLGRLRAMVKRGGESIAPAEIEEAVDEVAGVRCSAAVGCAGGDRSEELVVVAELERGAAATPALSREIVRRASEAVGASPTRVLLVPPRTIPRTDNGKTRHGELRRLLEEGRIEAAEQHPGGGG